MKYTREQLIQGMLETNKDFLKNPSKYTKIEPTLESATNQVDNILSNIKQSIMVITIEGKQGEGKTRLAMSICSSKKALFIYEDDIKNKEWLLGIDPDTEYLVVDDVVNLERTQAHLIADSFKIRRPYTETMTTVKMPPKVILIVQSV